MAELALSAEPSTVYRVPGGFAPPAMYGEADTASACASASNCALFNSIASAGSLQLTDRDFAACHASQVLVPTTATALILPTASPPRLTPETTFVGTTAIMPDGVRGVAARVPPTVGQCLMTA